MTIEAAPRSRAIRLQSGRDLVLHELSLLDLSDGEEILGIPSDSWFQKSESGTEAKVTAKLLGTVVWLMARKNGLSRQQILAKQWPFALNELMSELTMSDISTHGSAIVDCFLCRW